MIKGATSYRLFLVALWATLVVGALITQPQLSLKQTLLVLFSLAVAFLCQRWLFGTRYFGESAKVVAGTTREEEIYFAGDLIQAGDHIASEDMVLDAVLTPYRQMGIRVGFVAVVAPYALGIAWGQISLSVAGGLQIMVAMLVVPAMSLNHLLLPLAVSMLSVILQFKALGFGSTLLPLLYLAAICAALVFYRLLELEISRTSAAVPNERTLARRGLFAAAHAAAVLLVLILLSNLVIPESPQEEGSLSKLAAQLNQFNKRIAQNIPSSVRLTHSPLGSSPTVARGKAVAPQPKPAAGEGSAKGISATSPMAGSAAPPMPTGGAKLPGAGDSGALKMPNLSNPPPVGNGTPPELDKMIPGGRFTENGELPLASGAPKPADVDNAQRLLMKLDSAGLQKSPPGEKSAPGSASDADQQKALELARKFANDPNSPKSLPAPTPEQLAALAAAASDGPPAASGASGSQSAGADSSGAAAGTSGSMSDGRPSELASQNNTGTPSTPDSPDSAAVEPTSPRPLLTETRLRSGLLFILLAAIVLFARRLSRQGESKPVAGRPRLTREKRTRVLTEFAELNQMRVSPREEVILRYQFFLKLMAAAQFPKEDYLPASDFNQRLKVIYPAFARQSETITGTFCDTCYGEHQLTPEHMNGYRKSLEAVLRHFGC